MAQMVRKQIYLEKRQAQMLKRRAKQRGMSESEIVREALDTPEDRQGPDPQAIEEALEFMRSLEHRAPIPGGRDWTREDLYEERTRWPRS